MEKNKLYQKVFITNRVKEQLLYRVDRLTDSTKPLSFEIKNYYKPNLPFDEYMLLVYDHPMHKWN